MKYYRLISFYLLISILGLFTWWFSTEDFSKNVPSLTVAEQDIMKENYQAPFNMVFHFYQAVENNDWEKIRTLVTPVWWGEMHRSGYKQKWEIMIEDDPSINFVMFLVAGQNIDMEKGYAWIMGKADWTSAQRKMDDENVTIFLVKQDQEWKISSIRINIPVEVVEDFYQTINEGRFRQLPAYCTEKYWRKLKAGEVIDSLRADWEKNRTGVYCVFYLKDFGISRNKAWVKGDVLWNPLTSRANETQTTVFLTNINNGWKIEKITGHWEGEK
ncbi:MAG: hypothetical protein ACOX4H_00490 [Bacillota bacterium]|jgi:hypothetical protein|nr:hypothetical protein [Clostridia bacterium]